MSNKRHLYKLYALLCCFCLSYLWMLGTIFDPESISINVHHLENLQYKLQSFQCPNVQESNEFLILILVGSHPSHLPIRQVIRKTWGNPGIPNYKFKLIFLFGMLSDDHQNYKMSMESKQYGDIVQGDFQDSYYNVTIRDLMGFQWAWLFCQQAKYILHADDDIALDIYHLMDILKERFSDPVLIADSIGCYEIVESAIPRRYGRYAVSSQDYSKPYYANYCMGWLYVLTPSVAKRLVDVSLSTTPMWINDVHITGTLAQLLGLRLFDIGLRYTSEFKDMLKFARSDRDQMEAGFDMGPTRADDKLAEEIQQIYRKKAVASGLIPANGSTQI